MAFDREQINRRYKHVREIQDLLNYVGRRGGDFGEENFIVVVSPEEENNKPKKLDVNDQVLRLSDEVQDLKSLINRYFKTDIRNEATSFFKNFVSSIPEVKEVYVQHKAEIVVFWVFYEGNRLNALEKMVDAECNLENMFGRINFDIRVLSNSSERNRLKSSAELLYTKGD